MSIRQFLISTIAFAMLPTAVLRASDTVEYVGGTVKAIPMNTIGFLNTDDTKVLRFNYGQSVYKLPYDQITGTEITRGEARHVLKKFAVPALFGRKKETLTISYKDADGASGTLNFELGAKLAANVQETIAEQKASPQAAAAANQSDEWWGDKYWKTNANRSAWEAKTATADKTAPPAPVTTKN